MNSLAYGCLCASALAAGFSLPLGRGLLGISAALWVTEAVRGRKRPALPLTAWLWLIFAGVAWLATCHGVHPELGLPKLRKLVWFAGIPLAATLAGTTERRLRILGAYAVGTAVPALRALLVHPWQAWRAVQAGAAPDVYTALLNRGSMTDAQRFMLGALAALGFVALSRRGRERLRWGLLLLVQGGGLLLMFKRGSWLCTAVLAAGFAVVRLGRAYLLALLAVAAILAVSPPVQRRFAGLASEWTTDRGGRLTMWTRVTPALVKSRPWLGVGYRSLTSEMMRAVAPEVEPNRTHVHSNVLQVLVETGFLGLGVYGVWMAAAVGDAVRAWRRFRGRDRTAALIILTMLLALLGNGCVEYNFADAELVLVYGLLIGLAAAARREAEGRPGPPGRGPSPCPCG